MAPENHDDRVRAVWQSQRRDDSFTKTELHAKVEQMEKKMRRNRYDLYIALALSSVVIAGIAILFANPVILTGAALLVCGFGFLLYEVLDHRRRGPAAYDGTTSSLDYQRALLRHRLEFHRRRLWLRVLFLAPGGVLFFPGFAMARPDLAPLIYFQLFTFVVAILLIVPANRRAAAKLEREIGQIEAL